MINFFKSFLPFILFFLIQLAVTIPMMVIQVIIHFLFSDTPADTGVNFISYTLSLLQDTAFLQRLSVVFSITIIIIFGIYLILSNKITTPIMKTSFCLMISGGLGNLIDRIFRDGCVFDFIDLDFAPLKNFAIFNFADCLVVVGVIVMLVGLFVEDVFHDKGTPNA